jgi:hypothetical protein
VAVVETAELVGISTLPVAAGMVLPAVPVPVVVSPMDLACSVIPEVVLHPVPDSSVHPKWVEPVEMVVGAVRLAVPGRRGLLE